MDLTERRTRFRRILNGDACVFPASVFDPLSARLADSLGYEVGMLAGSVASAVVLGAPDVVVLTLSELAALARRITRASALSLMVDADHGYGNALNVMRTVEELEAAGVAALTIEDTALPARFGGASEELVSVPEMVGKLRAALRARQDPSLVLVGRTGALRAAGLADCLERARAYEAAGVDALFLVGVRDLAEVEAVRQVTSLPLLLGSTPPALADREALASRGVRIALQGHAPFLAALRAVYEALRAQRDGAPPAAPRDGAASEELLALATRRGEYARWQREFLR